MAPYWALGHNELAAAPDQDTVWCAYIVIWAHNYKQDLEASYKLHC